MMDETANDNFVLRERQVASAQHVRREPSRFFESYREQSSNTKIPLSVSPLSNFLGTPRHGEAIQTTNWDNWLMQARQGSGVTVDVARAEVPWPQENPFSFKVAAIAKVLARLGRTWGISDSELSVLLGFSIPEDWSAILEGRKNFVRDTDRMERARLLLRLDALLWSMYRDEEATRSWLRTKMEGSDRSALSWMLQGSMRQLFDVVAWVQAIPK